MLRRLTDDMQESEVVYLGFGLGDPDFREVVAAARDAVRNNQALVPRGYAVMLGTPSPFARNFWDTKKIALIDSNFGGVR